MANSDRRVEYLIAAKDQASPVMAKVAQSLKSLEASSKVTALSTGFMAFTNALDGLAKFNDAINEIANSMIGLEKTNMKVADSILNVTRKLPLVGDIQEKLEGFANAAAGVIFKDVREQRFNAKQNQEISAGSMQREMEMAGRYSETRDLVAGNKQFLKDLEDRSDKVAATMAERIKIKYDNYEEDLIARIGELRERKVDERQIAPLKERMFKLRAEGEQKIQEQLETDRQQAERKAVENIRALQDAEIKADTIRFSARQDLLRYFGKTYQADMEKVNADLANSVRAAQRAAFDQIASNPMRAGFALGAYGKELNALNAKADQDKQLARDRERTRVLNERTEALRMVVDLAGQEAAFGDAATKKEAERRKIIVDTEIERRQIQERLRLENNTPEMKAALELRLGSLDTLQQARIDALNQTKFSGGTAALLESRSLQGYANAAKENDPSRIQVKLTQKQLELQAKANELMATLVQAVKGGGMVQFAGAN